MKSRRVDITGLSLASCLGDSLPELGRALGARHCGLTREHRFKTWTHGPLGEVDLAPFAHWEARLGADDTPLSRVCLGLIERLVDETGVLSRHAPERVGFFCGTSTAGVETAVDALARYAAVTDDKRFSDHVCRNHLHGVFTHLAKKHFALRGPGLTITTACASAANAIAEAHWAVSSGWVDACIAGGIDVLTSMTICGFDALQILDPGYCQPFSKSRMGINLAEGGAFLLLERAEHPEHREGGVRVLARLCGSGASTDGHHLTHPEPQGRAMETAMTRALAAAGLTPADIHYVNAHGTGTAPNDAAEALAIGRVFGDDVPVSSTKGWHGHTLGASGALEAAVCIAALRDRCAWAGVASPDAVLEPGIRYLREPSELRMERALSNTFGFGGSNVSLIFERADAREGGLP